MLGLICNRFLYTVQYIRAPSGVWWLIVFNKVNKDLLYLQSAFDFYFRTQGIWYYHALV